MSTKEKSKRSKKEMLIRGALLFIGMLTVAFGIAFSIKGNLGTSPVSSTPAVLAEVTPFTVGNITIMMHAVFVIIQAILLRKKFGIMNILQIPLAIVFGYFCDFALWCIDRLAAPNYGIQWVYCIIGFILVGTGVALEVQADLVVLAAEGLCLAVCEVAPIKFGNMKIILDVSIVVAAIILSYVFIGHLHGVREGTVVAAIMVGQVAKIWSKPMKKLQKKLLPET